MTSPGRLHRGVDDAVFQTWNNGFQEAEKLLEPKRKTNPRTALEYAMLCGIRSLMDSTNENREALLDLFKTADTLATAVKYGEPMISDSSEEEDEAIALSAEKDCPDISEEDRRKIMKLKKTRKQQRAEHLTKTKQAKKSGEPVDMTWKIECELIYADALLVRALIQLMMNSYLKGGINLRKAWGCYNALIQTVEKEGAVLPEELKLNIKCGCGVFYTYLTLVPAGLMKLLSAIGFISDKDLGEQYLTEVFEANTIRSPVAALVLCTYYLFLPTGLGDVSLTLAKAKRILDAMNERFPKNAYFWGYTNFYHRKRGETKEAVEAIRKATQHAEEAGQRPLLLQYLEADTLYMDHQFEVAKKAYQKVLDNLKAGGGTFAYTGQIALSMAACCVMTNQEAEALQWLKKVQSMHNPKSKQDVSSPKFAARVLAEPRLLPLIGVYLLYLNRDLAHMKPDDVKRLRVEVDRVTTGKDLSPPEVSGMHRLFIGIMEKSGGHVEEAIALWEQNLETEKQLAKDSMVLPYTYYELGEVEFRRGNHTRAKTLFGKGQSFKGEGNDTLANRYGIALKQLKRATAAAGKK